ncbi:MAG: chromosomal replication initiator protein DnaA [Chloroflexia bacterium]|nr:chromosomal replication initiator protein DnaA [Chloroflexia bacterium]
MNIAKTWNSVLGALEIQLPRVEYNTWLRRTELVHLDSTTAVVSTATPMLREVVESRYSAVIREQLRDIIGYSVLVRVIVGAYVPASVAGGPPPPAVVSPVDSAITSVIPLITDEMLAAANPQGDDASPVTESITDTNTTVGPATAEAMDDSVATPASPDNHDSVAMTLGTSPIVVPAVVIQPQLPLDAPKPKLTFGSVSATNLDDDAPTQSDFFSTATRGMLNQRFTFDRFIIGSSNRLASAACMAVADHPAQAYNPLFLYGGVGLGKTHLLHAIGNAALERDAEINVLYVSSEKFTNDLINAIRRQQTEEFRIRYRNIDILLIDDIQFIAGKDATQEEFFHTFNTLHTAGKQIVLTSDRPPKAILTLEERLRSRFEWGLIVDIQMPDYETRTAIMRTKAEQMTVDVPAAVIEFLAQRIQSNIRELEGSLNRVVAYAKLNGTAISVESAQAALSDLLDTTRKKRVTGDMILRTVCDFYGVDLRMLQGRGRSRNIVGPRQVAMYLLREETDASLVDIGTLIGGRDHTTIMYGCDKIGEEIVTDNRLKQEINTIRERLYQG